MLLPLINSLIITITEGRRERFAKESNAISYEPRLRRDVQIVEKRKGKPTLVGTKHTSLLKEKGNSITITDGFEKVNLMEIDKGGEKVNSTLTENGGYKINSTRIDKEAIMLGLDENLQLKNRPAGNLQMKPAVSDDNSSLLV